MRNKKSTQKICKCEMLVAVNLAQESIWKHRMSCHTWYGSVHVSGCFLALGRRFVAVVFDFDGEMSDFVTSS